MIKQENKPKDSAPGEGLDGVEGEEGEEVAEAGERAEQLQFTFINTFQLPLCAVLYSCMMFVEVIPC